jgi:hypothetical protein
MIRVTRPHVSVTKVEADSADFPNGLHILVRTDAHCDSRHNDWKTEKAHLDLAQELGAYIVDMGDLFDAMQGRKDPRADPSDLLPELKELNYTDRLVEFAKRRYLPYAKNWLVLQVANHESAVLRHYGTNLTERLAAHMSVVGSHVTGASPYNSTLALVLKHNGTCARTCIIKLLHGSGGASPATGGVGKAIYRSSVYPEADIICSGHIHSESTRMLKVERYKARTFEPEWKNQLHLFIPGYKDVSMQYDGWEAEKEMRPGPVGAYMLRFRVVDAHTHQWGFDYWPLR